MDDPIATALREAQRELRKVAATNKARKARLVSIACDRLGYQEYLEVRDSIDRNITTLYHKLQRKDVPKVSKKKNALQYLINELRENRPIELYDGGHFFRDYMHVEDCCTAIDIILRSGPINDIYNVCNNESCEFGELIEMARRLLDSKSKITNIPEKKFHASVQVKNMHMDSTKLYRLGYKQRYGVNDTILELTGVVDNA